MKKAKYKLTYISYNNQDFESQLFFDDINKMMEDIGKLKELKHLSQFEITELIKRPTEKEMIKAGEKHINKNKKWSANDDTAGDNFGSFLAGAKWVLENL